MEQIFFLIFAIAAVGSALAVITLRNAVHSAIFLMVFIYVGAVMVLFLFAVMVLDLGRERFGEHLHHQKPVALIVIAGLIFVMGLGILQGRLDAPIGKYTEEALMKNTEITGRLLYTKYVFPFEVVSLLLLAALIGAIVLAMKEKK